MRLGPGKHLKGKTLMGGVVTPEEVSMHFFPGAKIYHAL
jgi:hypothetical protein